MRWIKEHKLITCIVAVIVALAVIFAVSQSRGGSGIAGKGVNGVVTVGEDAATSGISGIKGTIKGMFGYKSIMAENEKLKEEIAELEKELLEAEVTKDQLKQLKSLEKALNYKPAEKGKIVSADIIAFDGTTWLNSFTINQGTASGINKDNVAVCGTGLVGKVTEAGENWAKVVAVVDQYSKTSFTVLRDSDILGMVQGDGKGNLTGYVLDADSSIIEGDTLLTTGMGMYPSGIEMGTVSSVEYNADTQIKNITVEPSVNFKNITKVVVIT